MMNPTTNRRTSGAVRFDPAQAILERPRTGLSAAFNPATVAVIGATERVGSVGGTLLKNLIDGNRSANFCFKIFPVNPTRNHCYDLPCHKSIGDVPADVDLAVIVTPAPTVPKMMHECGEAGVRCAVVISAGFKELGEDGLALENEVIAVAKKYNVRVVGPNCLGVMNPNRGLNATFASSMARKGNIAFMSQSGAMCTAVLDWSQREGLGFSAFVSIGSMADVEWGDLIDYLGHDPNTSSILIYMETIGDAKHFLSAAKAVALTKPIIVIKAGKTQAAAEAAASHTGSLAGSHDAFVAAMKRVGVLLVDSIGELFNCALVLGKQPRPAGPRLTLITNAGGPGVLATDATAMSGAEVATLHPDIQSRLNAILPAAWSHSNPIDVLGDANAELYSKTLDISLQDGNSDGVLVILSPQSVTEPTKTAQALVDAVAKSGTKKPILASWMGGCDVREGFDLLNAHGIPTFAHPDAAAKTFAQIWSQTYDLQQVTETPHVDAPFCVEPAARALALKTFKQAIAEGRELLTEAESKSVLKAYSVPVADTIICSTPEEAVQAAHDVKFPCVVKLHSETITHKSDVGGVKLDIKSDDEIRKSFNVIKQNVDKIGPEHFQGVTVQPMLDLSKGIELIYGSIVDPQFGPLVLFGTGGCYVEIFHDTALAIPPLNATLANRLMQSTKIYKALKGGQGERFAGVDLEGVTRSLVLFSHMICDLSEYIAEVDINPMLAMPDRLVALDARVVLKKTEEETPTPQLAIRPYPTEYCFPVVLKDGTKATVRPTHPGDVQLFLDLHESLSALSVRQRYLAQVALEVRTAHNEIVSVCQADYCRLIALVAVDESSGRFIGMCRIARMAGSPDHAEIKLVVRDDKQGQGLGTILLQKAIDVARGEKIDMLRATVLEENTGFLKMAEKFGFVIVPHDNWVNVLEIRLSLSGRQRRGAL